MGGASLPSNLGVDGEYEKDKLKFTYEKDGGLKVMYQEGGETKWTNAGREYDVVIPS
jgi:hypothetical protein